MIKPFQVYLNPRYSLNRYNHFRFAVMGRRKNKNKKNRNNPLPYKTNEKNYAQTTRDNELFQRFYSNLGMMPKEEVGDFYKKMKDPLPVTFRITGYKSQASELLKIIRNQFFNKLITPVTAAGSESNIADSATSSATASESNIADSATNTATASESNIADSATSSATASEGKIADSATSSATASEGKIADSATSSATASEGKIADSATTTATNRCDGGGDIENTKGLDVSSMPKSGISDRTGLTIEGIQPPRCLSWYPGQLAWQIDLSRKVVRSQEILSKLHEFLVSETETGNISRQEAVSMIPPLVLDIRSNSKVLDMCAAPGSKTAQLIEYLHKDENTVPEGFIMANDRENKRCYLMVHQVKRLSSPCCVIVNHDATIFPKIRINDDENNKEFMLFDRVLADVPCSGDGTLRKNVDIWKKWNPTNAHQLHGLQLKILKRGLELLEVGGRLVYSTCSMHPVENEAVIAEMLRLCQGAVELVNISSYLPNLKTVPGLSKWMLMTNQGNFITKSDFIPPKLKHSFTPSMLPPTEEEAKKFNLHLCQRILPHHQDTGAFFVAALCKTQHLPWTKEAHLLRELEAKVAQPELDLAKGCTTDNSSGAQPEVDLAKGCTTDNFSGAQPEVDLAEGTSADNSTNNRKRRGESLAGPQPKKRVFGFKEDPFLFLDSNDSVWPPIRDFYGLPEDFPTEQLMYRCEQGPNRSLYFVNKAIRQIARFNDGSLKFVNMGVKFVSRSPSPLVPKCDYRITQECLGSLSSLFDKRKVEISKQDAVIILSEENPFVSKLSLSAQQQLHNLSPGSVVFVCKPSTSDPEPACEVTFCGWRGKTSVRSFVVRHERSHSLRLFGQDLSHIRNEVRQTKEEHQAVLEKKTVEDEDPAVFTEDKQALVSHNPDPGPSKQADGETAMTESSEIELNEEMELQPPANPDVVAELEMKRGTAQAQESAPVGDQKTGQQ